jgi:hypothetical protein
MSSADEPALIIADRVDDAMHATGIAFIDFARGAVNEPLGRKTGASQFAVLHNKAWRAA